MMPQERVATYRDRQVLIYLVELKSLPGYSGSPVFVYVEPFEARPMLGTFGYSGAAFGPKLLGIDCGHLPGRDIPNSGMAAVVPVARVWDLLLSARATEQREAADAPVNQ